MAITYTRKAPQVWAVKLGRKRVGSIYESAKGFRYFPIGNSKAGEFFTTLAACQKSLEAT